MSTKENVINLALRRKKLGKKEAPRKSNTGETAPVVDMTERRETILHEERRAVRRAILTEFIGVHCVVPNQGLMQVTLYDMSNDGLAFDVPTEAGRFRTGEEVAMRVYLNHQTYFPFVVKIVNVRTLNEEQDGANRHGATFLKGVNAEALQHFVKFIETVSASLVTDAGDVVVSKLSGRR
jgi:hypothetical protein